MSEYDYERPNKLLWVDLEMTGLDANSDRILEVAAIVTDFDFKELDKFEAVIYQPPEILYLMNEWAKKAHEASGLLTRVEAAPNEQHVVLDFADFIKSNFSQPAILAGNSIHQDRSFINRWWPMINQLLHYRMLDVSSFKILMQGKYNISYEKQQTHRALSDIKESIDELKFYLNKLSLEPIT